MPLPEAATVHGSPGEGARMAGVARATWPLFAVLFLCGYVAGAVARWPRFSAIGAGCTWVGIALLIVVGVCFCRTRIEAFFKGAAGEEAVARVLARLPAGYHVFHSLGVGGGVSMWRRGDIDHVVVCRKGVFVIETKNWRGRVVLADGRLLVDGRTPRRAPLDQVREAADTLQARLAAAGMRGVPLLPVVCFASDVFEAGCAEAGTVRVCNRSKLLDMLVGEGRSEPLRVDVDRVVQALDSAPAA